MKKRVTLQDLANELNTTPSTISRSLNDHKGISPEMKKKVKDLATRWNYRANAMASGLRTGYSKTIGVVVPMINRDFFSNVIAGIEKVAFSKGFNLIICQSHNDMQSEIDSINTLLESSVAGIFVSLATGTTDYGHFKKAQEQGFPIVFFDRVPNEVETTKIVINDFKGAYQATNHLIEMGYKNIAHFSGIDHVDIYKSRKAGYIQALEEHDIEVNPKLIVPDTLSRSEGEKAIEQLISLDAPPDAVFAASDYSALGAYTWLRNNNYNIPNDFGIVGFSNEQFTSIISPSLSTINQFSNGMGKYAAEVFFESLNSKVMSVPRTIQLAPELIIRESSNRRKI